MRLLTTMCCGSLRVYRSNCSGTSDNVTGLAHGPNSLLVNPDCYAFAPEHTVERSVER